MSKFQLKIEIKADTKSALRESLLEIVQSLDSEYGKPCQGIRSGYRHETKVITPVWDGKEY